MTCPRSDGKQNSQSPRFSRIAAFASYKVNSKVRSATQPQSAHLMLPEKKTILGRAPLNNVNTLRKEQGELELEIKGDAAGGQTRTAPLAR
jgi:hypothetical protein